MGKVIVCVAPVAHSTPAGIHNPLTPAEVAAETVACARAGAALVHLHVRDEAGRQTGELGAFKRTLDLIRAESDIVIQGSTGGLSDLSLAQRCIALEEPRVETASLNMGSTNFDDTVYINTLPDIRYWAGRMRAANIQPELEIFEAGMINNVRLLAEEGVLTPPLIFGLALGFRGASPADARHLCFLRNMLPADASWGLSHHGMQDFGLLAVAVGLGAAVVRVGFEDGLAYAPGRLAAGNVELVAKLVEMLTLLGLAPATPEEARIILGLAR